MDEHDPIIPSNPFGQTMDETIEYEGGVRLDSDTSDAGWSTDDDDDGGDADDVVHAGTEQSQMHIDDTGRTQNLLNSLPDTPQAQSPEMMTDVEYSSQQEHEDPPAPNIPSVLDHNTERLREGGISVEPSLSSSGPPRFLVHDDSPPPAHKFTINPVSLTSSQIKRILKEHRILQTSLPDGIYVRTWESRLDLLRVLIVGPSDTPYELAPFVFDFQFTDLFPVGPPTAHFHSWTNGGGRINPNLYEEGKCCLSLLGTWYSESDSETWSSGKSSVLQVLLSIMGLVLVKEPFHNEPGLETVTPENAVQAQQYTERVFLLSKGHITHTLKYGIAGFQDVVDWLYRSNDTAAPRLLQRTIAWAKTAIEKPSAEAMESIGKGGMEKLTAGAVLMLRRLLRELEALQPEQKGSTA